MSDGPVTSAQALADELSDVVNRYMNIEFGKAPGRTPNISFTLQSDPDAEAPIIPSGLFGRKS